jgi:general secretion pathway protein H
MALLAAMVLPRLTGSQEKAALQSAARTVAAGLRSTRSLAMTQARAEAFVVDTASGDFRAGSTAIPVRVPKAIRLLLITSTQEQLSQHEGSIRFFADGSSSGGGVTLAAGNDRDQVLVDWLTGRVSIEEGDHALAR